MDEIFFWSPSVQFKIENGELKIAKLNYGKKGAEYFPEFYYYIQDGCSIEELKNYFPENRRSYLSNLIKDFIKRRILVKGIISPKELFYSQKKLFAKEYDKEMLLVKEKLERFRVEQSDRQVFKSDIAYILENSKLDEHLENRHSVRQYSTKPISYSSFSSILGCLRNRSEDHTRYYPSAGGLATVDVYLYVKANRVEGIETGVYYYNPLQNSLIFVEDGDKISADAQYLTNKEIFESSAFTVYLVYNASASMPKYGGMAYFYGIAESGILMSLLTMAGEKVGVGSCCIGDMFYEKIKSCFHLNKEQVMLYSIEFGAK